ncbi:MAG: competence/damage-inducible protein A [Winogradskyella sp.]|uniref:competence/damage-inducible protein A n=1 Tax=Winogradskyella sp. TaxID=1883156 RepID=UPI001834FC23|nr:competence/damage-inducible protein A [Winogradskyella sp.]
MQAEIITIGDEILIGQIVDTNSAFLGKTLNKAGISIYQITSIQDDEKHILKALKEAEENADIVIITGGLGPTKDDITKHTLCQYFNDTLVENKEVLAHVEDLFTTYISTPISDINRQQALVPSKAKILKNRYGTAPGMWIEKGNKVFISLPGVPYEMKSLIRDEALPALQSRFKFPFIRHKTLLTNGLGESAIAKKIEKVESQLPNYIKLAYLPSLGSVRLRLSAKGTDLRLVEMGIEEQIKRILPLIEDIFVGYEDENTIETIIGSRLIETGKTLSIAESCTGGQIAKGFTANAGASKFFKGSIVSYSTDSKTEILKVATDDIEANSVVSKSVAEAMAINVRELFKSDIGISTTGNAGPTKGESDAEVGTVWIAIATEDNVFSEVFNFSNHREKVIMKASNKALEMLLKIILKK